MGSVVTVSDETFLGLVSAHDVLVLDLWASWCGPCMRFKPQFEAAADCYDALFATGLVDDCPALASDLGVKTIPTVAVYKEGQLVAIESGAFTSEMLQDLLRKAGVQGRSM